MTRWRTSRSSSLRLAVLADVHGNLPALEAIGRALAQDEVDHVVVAGDFLTLGPQPRECVEYALSRGWACIRGNSELYLTDFDTPRGRREWVESEWFEAVRLLSIELADLRVEIGCWPDELRLRLPNGPPIRVVHGSPRSAWEPLGPLTPEDDMHERLAGVVEGVVVCGHTHLVTNRVVGQWRVLNPGSAGNPLDGDTRAQYMLLDLVDGSWAPTWRRVAYDVDLVLARIAPQVDRLGAVGETFRLELETARTWLAPFRRWLDGRSPTPELLAELRASGQLWAFTNPHFRINPGPEFSP